MLNGLFLYFSVKISSVIFLTILLYLIDPTNSSARRLLLLLCQNLGRWKSLVKIPNATA